MISLCHLSAQTMKSSCTSSHFQCGFEFFWLKGNSLSKMKERSWVLKWQRRKIESSKQSWLSASASSSLKRSACTVPVRSLKNSLRTKSLVMRFWSNLKKLSNRWRKWSFPKRKLVKSKVRNHQMPRKRAFLIWVTRMEINLCHSTSLRVRAFFIHYTLDAARMEKLKSDLENTE